MYIQGAAASVQPDRSRPFYCSISINTTGSEAHVCCSLHSTLDGIHITAVDGHTPVLPPGLVSATHNHTSPVLLCNQPSHPCLKQTPERSLHRPRHTRTGWCFPLGMQHLRRPKMHKPKMHALPQNSASQHQQYHSLSAMQCHCMKNKSFFNPSSKHSPLPVSSTI